MVSTIDDGMAINMAKCADDSLPKNQRRLPISLDRRKKRRRIRGRLHAGVYCYNYATYDSEGFLIKSIKGRSYIFIVRNYGAKYAGISGDTLANEHISFLLRYCSTSGAREARKIEKKES